MLRKWFDPSKRELKRAKKIADQVFALEVEMEQLSDNDLKHKTDELKKDFKMERL